MLYDTGSPGGVLHSDPIVTYTESSPRVLVGTEAVGCILGYLLLPPSSFHLLYSNFVLSRLRGFPHSHVSVRVLPVGISVSH